MSISTPHDRLFRFAFSYPTLAAELCAWSLPAALRAQVDFSAMSRQVGEFVAPTLHMLCSDLVYCAPLQDTGEPLYFVLEHQSTVDSLMAWRTLAYTYGVAAEYRRAHPDSQDIPMTTAQVLHHGDRPWSEATNLSTLYRGPDDFAAGLGHYLTRHAFILDDLTQVTDQDLRERALSPSTTLILWALQRLPRAPDTIAALRTVLDLLQQAARDPHNNDVVTALLRYTIEVGTVKAAALRTFIEREASPQVQEALVNAAEELRQEGRLQGHFEGHREGQREGQREGRLEGIRESVRLLLEKRFGKLSRARLRQIEQADHEKLQGWLIHFVNAQTIDDVFAPVA